MDDGIVEAFWRTAQLKRSDIFSDDSLMPIGNQQDAQTPAPGWVGANYRPGGSVLVGINPGGGGDSYVRTATDGELYRLLRAFRDAEGEERRPALGQLSQRWIEIEQGHNLWRLVGPLLYALHVGPQEVACINVLPFRTRMDKRPSLANLSMAWSKASGPQLDALAPTRVFALGTKAHDVMLRLSPTLGPRLILLKRTIGDSYIAPETDQILQQLAQHYRS